MKRFLQIGFLLCLLFVPTKIFASGKASVSFNAKDTVYIGNTVKVNVVVSNISGTTNNSGVVSFGGNLSYDSSCLQMINFESNYFQKNGNKIAYAATNLIGFKTNTTIATITFKGLKSCSSKITIKDYKLTDEKAGAIGVISTSMGSKTINVTKAPSGNNNLSSLSVSKGVLNFDKNKTNYTVNVDSNVTSINISASSEDSKASVSGTGNKNLNYGNNKFSITVTAPSGSKKTYTVNVIRKDNRSSNTKLSSLSVSAGSLSPNFSSDTESYSVSVPYEVSSLNINAKAIDSKSKINIENNNLIAESTVDVRVIVTSENGSKRTYVIHATRGKDPNKVLSTNNYLESLNVSQGILSPKFDKEQLNYIVYLPYEIDSLDFNYTVADTKYAKVEKSGPDKLVVGNNQYKLSVTAEDNSTRVYTITVSRGNSITEQNLSSNIYLKEIILENGSLKTNLEKDKFVYYYKKGKDFHITSILPEDDNSVVEMREHDNVITILVKAQNGDMGVYTLLLSSFHFMYILFGIIFVLLIGIVVYLLYNKKRNKGKTKKLR